MSDRPPVKLALRWFTYLVVMPAIGLSTAFFGSIALLCGLWDKSGRLQHAIARLWARTLLLLTLSPVTVRGEARLRPAQVAVYAAKLPFQFRILAAHFLFKVPFMGWYLRRSGQVPIESKSSRSTIAGLLRGVKTLNSGLSIFVFPEGTRAPNGKLQRLQSGAAFMAIKAQVPLVPLALIGTYELLPMHVYHLTPRPLKLVIGEPIPTEGLTGRDADALSERLFAAIAILYDENS